MNTKSFFKKIQEFIGDVWHKTPEETDSRKQWWLVRQVRLILYTAQGVRQHNTVVHSAALTFYTLMSLVPFLALGFGIIKGFGFENTLEEYLYDRFPQSEALIANAFTFINNVLMRTSGGLVAITGMVVLVWAAASVFGNVESAFNAIWEVKQSRSVTRKASTYTAVIFILPLVVTLLIIILSYIRHLLAIHVPFSDGLLYWTISFALIWLILAASYKLIPNTKVNFGYAAQAALFAAIAFSAFQLFYISLQNSVSSYNIIYGSFAAIPLFLFWIQVSWQIILFGAELSFAFQNVNSFVQEQNAQTICTDNRRKVMIASLLIIIRSYLRNEGGISATEIAHTLHLPVRLVRDVAYTLDEAKIIVAITSDKSHKTKRYIPARDIHSLTLCDIISLTEHTGTSIRDTNGNRFLCAASEQLDAMTANLAASGENVLLTDLLHDEDNDHR